MSNITNEPSNFKNTEDITPNQRAKMAPQCILDLPPENPGRSSLTDEQFGASISELIKKDFIKLEFPRTMKLHVDPPLNGQHLGLVSFIPSKNAKPDLQGCYGVLKLRGTFPDERSADSWSENIIRNHDSYAKIDFCYVGKPFPLMENNEIYRDTTREIDIRRKVDEVQREDLKQKREQEKLEMSQVNERHRNLLRDTQEEKDAAIDDLELYVQLKAKCANLIHNKKEMERKIQETDDLVAKVKNEIMDMDKKHPDYKSQFLQRYKDALAAAGIPIDANPLLKYMID